jgi:hypothetical protein
LLDVLDCFGVALGAETSEFLVLFGSLVGSIMVFEVLDFFLRLTEFLLTVGQGVREKKAQWRVFGQFRDAVGEVMFEGGGAQDTL